MHTRFSFQRLPDGTYQTQPRDPVTGKRRTLRASTREELARQVARIHEARADLRLGVELEEVERRLAPTRPRLTVAECWERYERGLVASREVAHSTWERRLAPWFGERAPSELIAVAMKEWEAAQVRLGYARKTVLLAYQLLAACLRLFVPAVLPGLPWGSWRPARPSKEERWTPGRPAVTSIDQVRELVREATVDDQRRWARGEYSDLGRRVLFLALTGLRNGEAAGLAWDCLEIDCAPYMLWVRYQCRRSWRSGRRESKGRPKDPPKDGERRLMLHDSAVLFLRQQRDALRERGWWQPDGPVWPGRAGAWSETGIMLKPARLRAWAKRLGLPRADEWCTHSLRHTFATIEAISYGGDLRSVMERTGHSDVRILQGYMHAAGDLLAPSRIPAIAMPGLVPTVPVSPVPGESVDVPRLGGELAPLGDLAQASAVAQWSAAEARKVRAREKRRADRRAAARPFDQVAREWDAQGQPGARPREVDLAARHAYMRAYVRARAAGAGAEECRAKGRSAKTATLGAWGAAWARYQRTRRA